MAREPMPILDALTYTGATMYEEVERDREPKHGPVAARFAEALKRAVRVRAPWRTYTNVLSWEDFVKNLGPQNLPFPEMWFEYEVTDVDSSPVRVAAMVTTETLPEHHLILRFYLQEQGSQPVGLRTAMLTLHDEQGVHIRDGCFDIREFTKAAAAGNTEALKTSPSAVGESDTIITLAAPVLEAIGLMNCKNVHLERHTRPVKQPKKSRRKRPDRLDYHTIVLPGQMQPALYGDAETSDGSVIGFHKVRGHFRTYTAEKPLMGKHVGTYWFAPHVRGDKEAGSVVSDYRVEKPVLQSDS